MSAFTDIKSVLREKNGKKLAVVTVVTFLLIAAIVLFATFKICENVHKNRLNGYIAEIPGNVESSQRELDVRKRIIEEDALTRAELGLKIYMEESGLTDADELERVRKEISAASATLLDGQRNVIATTGVETPEDRFQACIQTLEPRALHLELYPAVPKEGEENSRNDGRGFVMIPVPGSANQSLVFEFSCDTVLEMYALLEDWSGMLGHILSDDETGAYAKNGSRLNISAVEDLTPEQITRLTEELTKVFQDGEKARGAENGAQFRIISLLGRRYLSALTVYPQEETSILLTVPLMKVIGNGIYIAVAILALIGWGIVLIELYVYRRLLREKSEKKTDKTTLKDIFRITWPGLLAAVVVTAAISTMLLLLENRTTVIYSAVNNRETLQYELDWRKDQEEKIRGIYMDFYRIRAQTLAEFVTDHPEYQTRSGLEELSRIAGTEYLMRFDKEGQEVVSSNSYTGFSVKDNLSQDYQAVLLGYPSAVSGPAADPYSEKMQIGAAIMMTNSAGQPDGFLLAVYSAGDLTAELKRMKLENTINTFHVLKGHTAAAINDADGCFIAHTDPRMIGLKAENYLTEVTPGSSYEGFATWNGTNVYVSAKASDGKTILFMVPENGDSYAQNAAILMTLAVLLILAGVYYPAAGLQSAKAMENAEKDLKELELPDRKKNPMMTFYDGYVVFMGLFLIAVLITHSNGWWTTFDYVFSGRWSKGLHLYSLWAAIFILVGTLFCVYLIKTVLDHLENRLGLRAKTITRLTGSLISYIAVAFLAFCILGMFGVNTTALIASAGIISIAVGMGAQSMAADLLAGFFMMLEGSVHVGDYVSVGGVKGYVTDMGIRTTEITDDNGNVVILNNSKVSGVSNMSRNKPKKEKKDEPANETPAITEEADDAGDEE